MKAQNIRNSFLKYFEKNEHKIYSSSSLIPENDKTLLFTVAGMVQFKPMFAGLVNLEYKRATSVQKCLRVVDLEEVGKSPFHDTFFEMLGNFSFGDYFQKEAIHYAWEYLTKELQIDKNKLYITVHKNDENAYNIWHKQIGISADKIFKMSDETNFWGPAGGTGACGPSSEIFYDFGDILKDKEPCSVENDCKRYIEIWNLVFPQFNQDKDGNRFELKNKGVDTGMGLERLAAVLQNKFSIFETDLFMPIIENIVSEHNLDYEKFKPEINSIADHIRALTFLIADGVIPSNEGRGYVVRRILRRAIRLAYKMNIEKEFLYKLSSQVIDIMQEQYPYLTMQNDKIQTIIKSEEKRFLSVIGQGISLYNFYKENSKGVLSGEVLFKLYDTFGFPIDLLKQMAEEDNLKINEKEFHSLLEKAREKSRQKAKFAEKEKKDWIVFEKDTSIFSGYEKLEEKSHVLMYRKYENNEVEVIFKSTPFYAESGGQVGDSGIIENETFQMIIKNTMKSDLGNIMIGIIKKGKIEKGVEYILKVDKEKRILTERNHTATHILHAVLRNVLGKHVHQEGSYVGPDKLRFDFTHFSNISKDELLSIEKQVNDIITKAIELKTEEMDYDKAIEKGAMALFTEKYDKKVRVVSIGNFSTELCGGTHVKNTSEIQIFKILTESSIAAGIRRIEAITSKKCYEYIIEHLNILDNVSLLLGSKKVEEIENKLIKLINENKEINKKLHEIKNEKIKDYIGQLQNDINNNTIIKIFKNNLENNDLRIIMDGLKSNNKKVRGALGLINNNRLFLIVFNQGYSIDSSKILKKILEKVNGRGGGRKDFASGSGSKPESIDDFINYAKQVIESEK